MKWSLSHNYLVPVLQLESKIADLLTEIFPSFMQPITFLNKKYLHLEFGSDLRVSGVHTDGSCSVAPTEHVFGEPALLHSHFVWFGKVGTHTFSLTFGMGINPKPVTSE